MKFISIDSSGKFCSISISLPNNIQESIVSTMPLSHWEELAVNVKKIIDQYNISISDLDFIIINIGPGSFTGLRIGVSFVKGLSLSNNIPVVPINSFDIIKNKIDYINKGTFYLCIYSHKNYAYAQKYNNGRKVDPKLIDLNDKIDVPMYISGLDSSNTYDNNMKHMKTYEINMNMIWTKMKIMTRASWNPQVTT